MANPEDPRPMGSVDAAEIQARGILAEFRMARHPLPQVAPADAGEPQTAAPSWTRERALAVLLPIAEGEASDSARVAAVAELNWMHGLHGPTLGQLVEAAQQPERKPWEGAI